jgi:hypothetical protein
MSLAPGIAFLMIGLLCQAIPYLLQAYRQGSSYKLLETLWGVSYVILAVGILLAGVSVSSARRTS